MPAAIQQKKESNLEYAHDGSGRKGEYKGLKPGLYEVREDKLYLLEDHEPDSQAAVTAAADKVTAALRKLLD